MQYSKGPATVACNNFSHLGRDGVSLFSMLEAKVLGNRMDYLQNIHGNGIDVYLDNRRITVEGNIITNTDRPMTAHGNGSKAPEFDSSIPVDIQVRNNAFLSNNPGSAAFSSWGSALHNVTFKNNVLGNPKYAVRMAGSEQNFSFAGNQIIGGFAGAGMATPTTDNSFYDPAGNGAAIVAAASGRQVSSTYCQ